MGIMKPDAERIKSEYPKGTLVELIRMVDAYTVPAGTRGVVHHVDDIGTIHVDWLNGRRLGLIPDIDDFKVIATATVADEVEEETEQEETRTIQYTDEGIVNLRIAIVEQAAKDYRQEYKHLLKLKKTGASDAAIRLCKDRCLALERWFASDWGNLLSHELGGVILARIRAEVEEQAKGGKANGAKT